MKYIANPVEVDAFEIKEVLRAQQVKAGNYSPGDTMETKDSVPPEFFCVLDDGSRRHATPGMCSRMTPKEGDFWVVQSDGYEYLNPREVFLRKYRAK